jgi:hypothetical protein
MTRRPIPSNFTTPPEPGVYDWHAWELPETEADCSRMQPGQRISGRGEGQGIRILGRLAALGNGDA